MLLMLPREMYENPSCYKIVPGKGYVPTETATAEERCAIGDYERQNKEGRERMVRFEGEPPEGLEKEK